MSIHSKVTRYGLVGAGARSFMFSDALLDIYQGTSSLVALCDVAGHLDGARSVLTGIAANQSFATGQPVQIDQLLKI